MRKYSIFSIREFTHSEAIGSFTFCNKWACLLVNQSKDCGIRHMVDLKAREEANIESRYAKYKMVDLLPTN